MGHKSDGVLYNDLYISRNNNKTINNMIVSGCGDGQQGGEWNFGFREAPNQGCW